MPSIFDLMNFRGVEATCEALSLLDRVAAQIERGDTEEALVGVQQLRTLTRCQSKRFEDLSEIHRFGEVRRSN